MEQRIVEAWKQLRRRPDHQRTMMLVISIIDHIGIWDGSVQAEMVRMVRDGKARMARWGSRADRRQFREIWDASVVVRPSECPGHKPGRYQYIWIDLARCEAGPRAQRFGAAFRRARIARGLTFRELAAALGTTISYLADIDNGLVAPPDQKTVARMERLLGVTTGSLCRLALHDDELASLHPQNDRTDWPAFGGNREGHQ